jgi:hydroxymethylpyrimidine pyrophosphatase-like HAD family hydrolase
MADFTTAVYVFDLDGVINDPKDSSVDAQVVAHMYQMLLNGAHVAINTGRSYDWVEKNLVDTLRAGSGGEDLSRLYIVCEKGGEHMLWQDGDFVAQPSRFALDQQAYDITKQTFNDNAQAFPAMFWDGTKRTMATIEKVATADLAEFHGQQERLAELLSQKLQGFDVKVDATTIATDVQSPSAGKHAGAELIYEWVRQHTSVEHDTFICFGDSTSDYEMARYFAQQGANTTFVFVGKPTDSFDEDQRVKLIRTSEQYAAGTREYFEHALAD